MKYLLDGQETERLTFRPFTKNDLRFIEDLFKDPRDRTFLALPTEPSTKELCDIWFGYCQKRYDNDTGGMNALIDKANGKLAGMCGLLIQEVDGIRELEVAYAMLPQYRNKGLATEAAKKCRDVAFKNAYADSLISIIHLDNEGSEKVAVNNGMIKTKKSKFNDLYYNIYRIDKVDWEKLPAILNKKGRTRQEV